MSVPVRQNLVPASKYPIKCPNEMSAQYITIHNTANDASANNEISYMIGNDNQVSFHFAVDDIEVVQGIPLNRNAWHCTDGNGDGNRKSIGVEICYSLSGGERYDKAETLAIKFVAQLLKERGWGVDKVRKHQDWSGKYCPHRILDIGRWQSFLDAIQAELEGGNDAVDTTPILIDGKKYTVNRILKNSRNYVELKEFEQAGYIIAYDESERLPSIQAPNRMVESENLTLSIDGEITAIKAENIAGRWNAPIRDILSAAGYASIIWEESNKIIVATK